MKRFTRSICFILAFIMVFAISAFAAESADTRASYFFMSSSTYLWKTSSTTFRAWFDVDAVGMMDEIGVKEIKIQKSSDGENWTTMCTYTKDLYSHFIAKNTGTHAGYITYTGTPGYYYRAYVCYYAKKGTDTGEMYKYTSSMLL